MSIKIMSQVWDIGMDDSTAKLALMALADFADDEGYCFPSYEILAKKISKSKRTAIRVVEKLVETGCLQKEKRQNKDGTNSANLYKINIQKEIVSQAHPMVTNKKEIASSVSPYDDTDDTSIVSQMSPDSVKCVTPINLTTNEPSIEPSINRQILTPLPPTQILPLPDFLDPKLWQDYLAYKAQRKEKLSQKGIEMKFHEWAKWHSEGIDVNACIREAMANEWQGVFKPKGERVQNAPNNQATNPHGLRQGTLNTMRAFDELAKDMIANGQGHLVGDSK